MSHELIQERYVGNPWKILICAILVRKTKGERAKEIARKLFLRYPTASKFVHRPNADDQWILDLLQPLGLQNIRLNAIEALTYAFLKLSYKERREPDIIRRLPEVGNYAMESFRLFVSNDTSFTPKDKVLALYVKSRSLSCQGNLRRS